MSIELVCNAALDLIGYKRHIGSIWDGTPAARAALDLWGLTRDELLAVQPWDFARQEFLLVSAGLTAPSPWLFEYLYPTNAIRLLGLRPGTIPTDPEPVRFLEIVDARLATPSIAILSTLPSGVVAVATGRVFDPNSWAPEFTALMTTTLAKKFQANFAGKQEVQDDSRGRSQQRA